MNFKIVSDSSANPFHIDGITAVSVPLKIVAGDHEWVDDANLNLDDMVSTLKKHKGKSGSSCPNVQDWLDAFQGADNIFALTISKELSGSYSAACNAAEEFMAENPGKKVFVLDSQAAGPEMIMLMNRIRDLILEGLSFEEVKESIIEYHKNTHTLFCLQSMTNLARNGRVSMAAATIAGVLGIRAVGDVQHGQITPIHKPRGQKKATEVLAAMIRERGFTNDSWLRIAHCFGEAQAQLLIDAVRKDFPNARYTVEPTGALCSFYAEEGGLMIAMEGAFNEVNNVNAI